MSDKLSRAVKKLAVGTALLFAVLIMQLPLSAFPAYCEQNETLNSSGVSEKMLDAQFWTDLVRDPEKVLMSAKEIAEFSAEIKRTPKTYCTDVAEYPAMIPAERVRAAADPSKNIRKNGYIGNILPDKKYIAELTARCGVDTVQGAAITRFAFVTSPTFMRAVPTDDPSYEEPDGRDFDMYVMTLLKVWEPLAIIHKSADGQWYYAVSPSADGWVKASDTALTDRRTLKQYLSGDFVIVTGSRINVSLSVGVKREEFMMGTRFPLADKAETTDGVAPDYSYDVLLPTRDSDGQLAVKNILIPRGMDVHHGFLPYTQKNVITQAFKTLGECYGWGGSFYEWDCSSLVRDVYLTMGFELPRNSRVQTRIKALHIKAAGMDDREKERLITSLPAGAILQMPGHTTLCIGTYGGKPYIIHSAYAYGKSGGHGAEKRMRVNCVAVSDLDITRKNGGTFLHSIENIISIAGKK